ncbi:MAG: DUF429 domain-containing protein [Myxococcota bacterium]
MFVGADGCKQGWVAVAVSRDGFVEGAVVDRFAMLLQRYPGASVVGVDTPVGLVEQGPRSADAAARAVLKGRASSVFNAPTRPALNATSYAAASAASRESTGKGLSKQSYNLFDKIRDVDAHALDPRVFEVHPEVAFRVMNEGAPLLSKKTWGGMQRRLALLAEQGIAVPADSDVLAQVGIDDVLDAAACAWSARRIDDGSAQCLAGEPVQRMASGRPIAIWA